MFSIIFLASLVILCQTFDFREIVIENQEFDTYVDRCPLRIVGGVKANIHDIPYQVAIRQRYRGVYWFAYCGGSLITLRYVLSASHCFVNPDDPVKLSSLKVVAGTTRTLVSYYPVRGEQSRKIKVMYQHEHYKSNLDEHDIAILEMEQDFVQSPKIKPIRMVSNELKVDLSEGTLALISGFGLKADEEFSDDLQMVCVPILKLKTCKLYFYRGLVTKNHFCTFAKNKDSCQGDSGGPVVCHGILVGIVSFGAECGLYPGVSMRLESYTTGYIPFVARMASHESCFRVKTPSYVVAIVLINFLYL